MRAYQKQPSTAQRRQLLLEDLERLEATPLRKQWMVHMLSQYQSAAELDVLLSEFNELQTAEGKCPLVHGQTRSSPFRIL